jgi:ribosomal protein S18 acetylase RimI-like enzyme
MLVEAADWRHDETSNPGRRDEALSKEKVARYILGWGRDGDDGIVAIDGDDAPIGACWLRLFPAEAPAYGFVAPDIPELAIGVAAGRRGKGLGRTLMRQTLDLARAKGYRGVSLSVDHDNPARNLYLGEGFVVAESRDTAATMITFLD